MDHKEAPAPRASGRGWGIKIFSFAALYMLGATNLVHPAGKIGLSRRVWYTRDSRQLAGECGNVRW